MNSGSISLTRYRVLGLNNLSIAKLSKNFAPFQAKKIRFSGTAKPELVGWALPLISKADAISQNDHWDMSHCRTDAGFALKVRLERRVVPQELLRIIFVERLEELENKSAKPLSRQEKKTMREALADELLEQALPTISYLDAMWDDLQGQVLLFTASKKARDLFENLFRKSFTEPHKGTLIRVAPPLMGLSDKEWMETSGLAEALERLASTVPASFSAGQSN
jgi:recombination associated protein RdgC